MLPCTNKQLFGIDCPGCGTQRAIFAVFRGDFAEAFHLFPAIYTMMLLFLLIGFHLVDKTRNYTRIIIATAIANGAIIIFSYLYKLTNI